MAKKHQLSVIIDAGLDYDRYCSDNERLALLQLIKTFSCANGPILGVYAGLVEDPEHRLDDVLSRPKTSRVTVIMDAKTEYDNRCNKEECRRLTEMLSTFSVTDDE